MINAINVLTCQVVQLNNPDEERFVMVEEGKLWTRHLTEVWGPNKLTVFRSRHKKQLVWMNKSTGVWAFLHPYEEDKEDNDEEYAASIDAFMSGSEDSWRTMVTTTSTKPAQKKRGHQKPPKQEQKSFQVPAVMPSDYASTYCSSKQAKEWFKLQKADLKQWKHERRKYEDGTFTDFYLMADCWKQHTGFDCALPPGTLSKDEPFIVKGGTATTTIDPTSDPAKSDPAKSDPAKIDLATTDQATTDQATTDQATTESATTDPATAAASTESAAAATTDPATAAASTESAATNPAAELLASKQTGELSTTLSKAEAVIQAELTRAENLAKQLEEEKKISAQLAAERDQMEAAAQNASRLHENYKKRKAREFQIEKQQTKASQKELDDLKQAQKDAEEKMQKERDAMKAKYDQAQAAIKSLKAGNGDPNSKAVGENCIGAYLELIKQAHAAYMALQTPFSSTYSKYEVCDPNNNWIAIDSNVEFELDKLTKLEDRVQYSFGGHQYQARLVDPQDPNHLYCDIYQVNLKYSTERMIRAVSQAAKAAEAQVLSQKDKYNVLFGNSPIKLSPQWVDTLLKRFSFDDHHYHTPCRELAELAELFNSFSHGYKYVNGRTHKTDLFVKPILLYNWLVFALARNYTAMRLILHGSDTACYDGVRDDPFGMDLKYAGMHGQVYGNGFYFGLSDHITNRYNKEGKPGTALIALVLTHEKFDDVFDWHTGSGLYKNMSKFKMSSPPQNDMCNCIVVHEAALILILGKIVTL